LSSTTSAITPPAAGSSPARFAVLDRDLSPEWHALLSQSQALAVDTEAMGLVHGRDRLCLVQIAMSKTTSAAFASRADKPRRLCSKS
jgi:ribonuclease D